ncbi:hypothetical protein LTR53_020263, partial [Teratosphaeriaceae sp. CCFEE 6253]
RGRRRRRLRHRLRDPRRRAHPPHPETRRRRRRNDRRPPKHHDDDHGPRSPTPQRAVSGYPRPAGRDLAGERAVCGRDHGYTGRAGAEAAAVPGGE